MYFLFKKVSFIDFFDLFNSKPAVWFEVCLCYAPYCPSPAKGNYSFLPAENVYTVVAISLFCKS